MAVSPKSLFTRGLFKTVLDARGVRLETRGLASASSSTEIPSGVSYIFGILHPFIHRLRSRIHRGA